MIEVKCPHCDYSREVPQDKIPSGRRTVTCPHCQEKFPFDKNNTLSDLLSASVPIATIETPVAKTGTLSTGAPSDNIDDYESVQLQGEAAELSPIKELFPRIWQLIKEKGWVVLATWLASALLVALGSTLFAAGSAALIDISGNSALVTISAVVLGAILLCYALGWLMAATMCAIVADEINPATALAGGRAFAWPYFWLMTLFGHMLFGGTLLLIIPGIMFYAWFFFAQYLVVAENVRGMDALLLSREYVRGHGWGIFGRLLLLSLLMWLATLALSFVPFVGPIITLLLSPFAMLMPMALYLELRTINPAPRREFSRGTKALWLLLGTLGYLLIAAAVFWGWNELIALLPPIRM